MWLLDALLLSILSTIFAVVAFCGIFLFIVECYCCFGDLRDESPVLPTVIMTTETAGPGELDAIPTFLYCTCGRAAGDQVEECTVCLERFELLQKIRRLPGCGHCFHAKCIDAWLWRNPTCPLCRRRLRLEHVVVVTLAPPPRVSPPMGRALPGG